MYDLNISKVLNKFLQNKHILLLFVCHKNQQGCFPTVIDAGEEFEIEHAYGYKLLEELESGESIVKCSKILYNGEYYNSYKITETAKLELREISRIINEIL